MRGLFLQLVIGLIWSILAFVNLSAQTGQPYFLYDSLGTYYLATADLSTGAVSDIGPIPGVSFWVLGGKYCINAHDSTYTFVGHDGSDARLYTISLADASILSSPLFNGVKVGLKYNCGDSSIYAIEEQPGGYDFVRVNRTTGATDSVGFFPGITAYVGETFALDGKGGNYHFMGIFGSNFHLLSINLTTGSTTYSPIFTENPTGFAYSCKDSNIYAMWEDSLDYTLMRIDPISGTQSAIGVVPGVDPGFITESASMSFTGQYTYRGFFGGSAVLVTVDVGTAGLLSTPHFGGNAVGFAQWVCCMPTNPIITALELPEHTPPIECAPNPFSAFTTLHFPQHLSHANLKVLNTAGEIVQAITDISGEAYHFSGAELSSGLYFIEVWEAGDRVFVAKLVKE